MTDKTTPLPPELEEKMKLPEEPEQWGLVCKALPKEFIDYANSLRAAHIAALAEIEQLKHDISRHMQICNEHLARAEAAEAEIGTLRKDVASKQARIDELMLEYCPDEMTPEQLEEWCKHQQLATPAEDVAMTPPSRRKHD